MKRKGWNKALHQLWAYSLIVTLPVTLVFFVWLFAVNERYNTLGVRLDVQGGEAKLLRPIMEYEWYLVRRRMSALLAVGVSGSELRSVELWLSDGAEGELNQNLPTSGREYAKGEITYPDGSLGKASLRYRGDMMHHWALGKKSWRIKTKKKKLWNGLRKFNLIVPETWGVLEEHFGYRLATDLGLLAPVSEVVDLRINGSNRGVHTLVGQVDELFLRRNERMPGDLFVGDLVLGDAIPGFENKVFDLPGMWTKAAINNHYADEHAASMFRLCAVLDWAPGPRKAKALENILDLQACARFAAYRSLVQSGHVDSYHNWKLYYDPWRNRFEPVVWDPNAWGAGWAPTLEDPAFEWPLFAEFDRVLVHDHRYRWAKHKALYEFFQGSMAESLLADMADYGAKVVHSAKSDPALAFSILPSSPEKAAQGVETHRAQVQEYFDLFRARHVEDPARIVRGPVTQGMAEEWTLPVTIDGWKPVAGVRLTFGPPVPAEARFYWSVTRAGEVLEAPARATVQGATVTLDQPLLPGVLVEAHPRGHSFSHKSSPRPLTYQLRMVLPGRKMLGLKEFASVDLGGTNRAVPIETEALRGEIGDDFAALFRAADPAPVRWSGSKRLDGLTEIHGDLVIEAGTELAMDEGASVIVHGRLTALGNAQEPILIGPARAGQKPWGTLAIRTPRADGSILQHVHMRGGSGYMDDLQEYSGMFSAHDADGLRLLNCRFENGRVVDDMVHVVYGKNLQITDCSFSGALSDALDLDGCQGRIERCHFDKSGNDAIDLMMSQVEVHETILNRSGDKGVSVGEGSELLWSGGRVLQCGIGIQVKDGSLAWIRGATFQSNGQALHAYTKNWQYGGGGDGLVQDCEFRLNDLFADADENSSWSFVSSRIPESAEAHMRLHQLSSFSEQLPSDIRRKFQSSQWLGAALDD
ncbi:MAG: hypothetical protein ACI9X4_001086 [Glaciecola sp.]